MTIAQQVARLLGDDGTVWETQDGRTLEDLAKEYGAYSETRPRKPYLTRYAFDDGSAIVASEAAWDIEGSVPWSWAGVEGSDDEAYDTPTHLALPAESYHYVGYDTVEWDTAKGCPFVYRPERGVTA